MTNVALERVLSAGDAENLNIAQLNKQKSRVWTLREALLMYWKPLKWADVGAQGWTENRLKRSPPPSTEVIFSHTFNVLALDESDKPFPCHFEVCIDLP